MLFKKYTQYKIKPTMHTKSNTTYIFANSLVKHRLLRVFYRGFNRFCGIAHSLRFYPLLNNLQISDFRYRRVCNTGGSFWEISVISCKHRADRYLQSSSISFRLSPSVFPYLNTIPFSIGVILTSALFVAGSSFFHSTFPFAGSNAKI